MRIVISYFATEGMASRRVGFHRMGAQQIEGDNVENLISNRSKTYQSLYYFESTLTTLFFIYNHKAKFNNIALSSPQIINLD